MREFLEIARDLWHERRRYRMVVLALTWGTLGLTVLVSFGNGFERAMRTVLARCGDRMLRLTAGSTSLPERGLPAGRLLQFDAQDVDDVRGSPELRRVSVEYALGLRVAVGDTGMNANVRGVDPCFAELRGLPIRDGGRFLSPLDERERRRVAVIGEDLARSLFHGADPLGREVRLGDLPHRIVGVVPRLPMVMNYDGDDAYKLFVPAGTLRANYALRAPSYLLCEPSDPQASVAVASALRARLAQRMGFDPADDRAVPVRDSAADARRILALVLGTRLFLTVVGVLGLFVCSIGIANSMIALTEERIAEIGLRRALGATRRQIMSRPVAEAFALVLSGGGGGFVVASLLLLGLGSLPLDDSARGYLGSPIPTPGTAAAVAVLLGVVAAVAAIGPARRAMAVEPVEALRHD
ncbi:MAG: ABC transporter permease [Planctomycetota bacterium]